MTMARVRMLLFAAATCCFCLLMGSASAHENATVPINHIVGGSFGWQLPENNKTLYEDWTRNRVFGVGDTLTFPYRTGGTLMQVDRESYHSCKLHKVLWMFFKGPSNFTLRGPGSYYFINALGRHCEQGQKLHVRAEAGKQGSSGTHFSFKITLGVDRKSTPGATLGAAAAPKAVSPAPTDATAAPAPAPKSAATSIQNVGIASGLFAILFSLFI
ncbi:PREDICTED: early nodulin-like protein 3 [Fragaria vesca subsp. vesca]|uniref:early nodulin-like protein 3 n=1 Tax=Fragaria vesca subsp. vesca TaxID=101020 RepID=UPI0002C378D6|nr:PREDICTED: early nodulin-like protein 3 [Fragaria vesca subsp. vesca]